MKVVLDSEADREFVAELRNSFPSVNFCQAPTEADQVREIPDAEVLFGAITPAVFEAARRLRWCHFVGRDSTSWCGAIPHSWPAT